MVLESELGFVGQNWIWSGVLFTHVIYFGEACISMGWCMYAPVKNIHIDRQTDVTYVTYTPNPSHQQWFLEEVNDRYDTNNEMQIKSTCHC